MIRTLRPYAKLAAAVFVATMIVTQLGTVQSGEVTCDGPCPLPSPCSIILTPHYDAQDAWTLIDAQHEYSDDITIYGYDQSCINGGKSPFSSVWARTMGEEGCPPTNTQHDWDKSGYSPDGTEPWVLEGFGGYASGGCMLGHWIRATVMGHVTDATTGIDTDVGDNGHCTSLFDGPLSPVC